MRFIIEERTAPEEKKYLWVKIYDETSPALVHTWLRSLNVVDHVNDHVDNDGKAYFIVYPAKCFDLQEVIATIESTLDKLDE